MFLCSFAAPEGLVLMAGIQNNLAGTPVIHSKLLPSLYQETIFDACNPPGHNLLVRSPRYISERITKTPCKDCGDLSRRVILGMIPASIAPQADERSAHIRQTLPLNYRSFGRKCSIACGVAETLDSFLGG